MEQWWHLTTTLMWWSVREKAFIKMLVSHFVDVFQALRKLLFLYLKDGFLDDLHFT